MHARRLRMCLPGNRTMHETDVVVIGAGAAGVAAARAAARRAVARGAAGGARRASAGARGRNARTATRARSRLWLVALGRHQRVGRARAHARLRDQRSSAAVGAAGLGRQFLRGRAEGLLGRVASLLRPRRCAGGGRRRAADVGLLRAGRAPQRHARRDGDLHQRRGSRENRARRIRALSRQRDEQAHAARLRRADRGLCGRARRPRSIAR